MVTLNNPCQPCIVNMPTKHQLKIATPEIIILAVCTHFGITETELKIKLRFREKVTARRTAIYFLIDTHLTLTAIGRMFNQHHTTIMNSRKVINDFISINDPQTLYDIAAVETLIDFKIGK